MARREGRTGDAEVSPVRGILRGTATAPRTDRGGRTPPAARGGGAACRRLRRGGGAVRCGRRASAVGRSSGSARGRTAARTLARRGTGAGGVEPRDEVLVRGHGSEPVSGRATGQPPPTPSPGPPTETPATPRTPLPTCPFLVTRGLATPPPAAEFRGRISRSRNATATPPHRTAPRARDGAGRAGHGAGAREGCGVPRGGAHGPPPMCRGGALAGSGMIRGTPAPPRRPRDPYGR